MGIGGYHAVDGAEWLQRGCSTFTRCSLLVRLDLGSVALLIGDCAALANGEAAN